MGGGAWPFLVGGVICLVNSVNERDLNLLNSFQNFGSILLVFGTEVMIDRDSWGGQYSKARGEILRPSED